MYKLCISHVNRQHCVHTLFMYSVCISYVNRKEHVRIQFMYKPCHKLCKLSTSCAHAIHVCCVYKLCPPQVSCAYTVHECCVYRLCKLCMYVQVCMLQIETCCVGVCMFAIYIFHEQEHLVCVYVRSLCVWAICLCVSHIHTYIYAGAPGLPLNMS